MQREVNECRTARVAEVLADFRTLQYYIAAGPVEPENEEDYYTEGWAALRQCTVDGQYILDVAADTRVPAAQGGEEEQTRAELQQVLLDAYARRHEGQKILLRQAAAQRWIEYRDQVLQGQRPHPGNHAQLQALDNQLRAELAAITDEYVYAELLTADQSQGRWTMEDPSLRRIQRWLQARQR
ncbi:uncharacterized protein TRIVIDRAFT_41088 [Trichoderma virens Gv29-8]|uniref:Uncharacterized protein n=1 Tax=Hypocrea virens (strain Gv29-8 / FGSC 10586) TaxID=413071 RepID=G9N9D4_HYPVG|nr:uncharacterized protein TRIVIDRAFT_41088 [Trichoderma virens Gv29-8]EHK16555.1 hypothetical protein TRIVIDRAFT_41088 [Trichoderma virens Gv29-8]UKZ52067.1 hypothetical protein TrVGV298_005836 [Trichoderma virens]UKZ77890.1 hypothetical protein TrVFT333_005618 [Trichoderma virens FT-333]